MSTAKIYSIYSHPKSTGIDFSDSPSLTKQSFADECDVNNILAQYNKTGVLTHVRESAAQFGDFSDIETFQESMQRLLEADAAFMALPAKVRREFDNDPMAFLEACSDPAQLETMVRLGLAEKRNQDDPGASPSISDGPPASPEGNQPKGGSAKAE